MNATKPNPFEIIPLQTTRKENNWKTKEALVRAAVTLETKDQRVQSLMFMMMKVLAVWWVGKKVKHSHYRPGQAQRVLRKLRFPDFMTTAQNGGNVVSLTHRPSLPPGNTPGTHFC